MPRRRVPATPRGFSGTRCPFGGLGDRLRGRCRRAPRVSRGFQASRERAADSSFPASDWKAGRCSRVCSWQPGARAPRPHHPGAGMCALPAPALPPSHVCAAGARGPGGARHRAAPGVGERAPALGGTLAGDPERSLGPAGRRRRAGAAGETIICSVVMRTVTVGRGSISQACLLSLTIFLVPGPTRTVCSFIATVKAGSCQNSARAHTHTDTPGKTFLKK